MNPPLVSTHTAQLPPPPINASNVVTVGWLGSGRRSPTLYAKTQYGMMGVYLGSNPDNPSPTFANMSFRTSPGGPVGGGSLIDCWPGPLSMAVADATDGSGRVANVWDPSGGCGEPEQAMALTAPGGSLIYGQQIDVSGTNAPVSYGVIGAAYTSGGNYAGYFGDSSAVYVVDLTNLSFKASTIPLPAIQTLGSWAKVSRLAVLGGAGGSGPDLYLAGIFYTASGGTVKLAAIGSDGKLSVLTANASLSSSGASSTAQMTAVRPVSGGYLLFVTVSTGVDVFFFDGTTLVRRGTIANTGSNKYTRIAAPVGASAPILLAEKSNPPDIDIYAGGFLAGQSGSPALATTVLAAANDQLSGFGAYVDASVPDVLYTYRIVTTTALLMQSDTWDISCVASPPSPNPTASFILTNKSAQARTDKATYVGDTFSFTDNSKAGTGGSITSWYVWANYDSSTASKANADLTAASAPSLPTIVFPCQSLANSQCSYSPVSITAAITQKFGELVSAGALDSTVATSSVSVKVPLTRVPALGSDGSVKILTGGSIDASASDGSPTSFAWSFNGAAYGACAAAKCVAPSNATAFTVAAKYAGGYQAAAVGGTVAFTDIAGSITVPSTLYSGQSTTTATFALQKGSGITITGVSYRYDNGAATPISPLPGLASSVTINVPALATGQSHTITFLVTYTGGSLASLSFQDSFTYSAVQYAPKVWMSKQQSATATDTCSTNVYGGGATTCSGSPGTFYVSDAGDAGKPGFPATWDFGDGSPLDTSHLTTDFVPHSYPTSGNTYTLKLTVAGTTVSQKFSTGQLLALSASISGPTSRTSGQPGTWSAFVSGGKSPYTYSWHSSDGGTASTASFAHTFASSGTISLIVYDSAGASRTASLSVTVGSGGGGANQLVITGPSTASPSGTWTAAVGGSTSGINVKWTISAGSAVVATSTSNPLTYAFPSSGTYTLQATGTKTVTGGGIVLLTPSLLFSVSASVNTCGSHCPPVANFTVTGAQSNPYGGTGYKAGDVLTFTATDTANTPTYQWDFGDGVTRTVSDHVIQHAFADGGLTYHVSLTVTTDFGQDTRTQALRITGQGFSALIVPGAGHLESAVPVGAFATELSLFNGSDSPVTVALDFETADKGSIDPTKIAFPTSGDAFRTIPPNQGWSIPDVTNALLGNPNALGTLFIKYTGSQPSALARIYFSSGEGDPTYGTYLPVYPINAAGPVLSTQSGGSAPVLPQDIVGLKFDDDYRGGLTIVSASPTGGRYEVNLFRDDEEHPVATLQASIAGYQQVKLGANEFGITQSDPGHIYFATVAPSEGFNVPSIAVGTVTDSRTRDSLLLTDDTPRLNVPAGQSATYYVAGAGRFASSKTDLYVLNTSAHPVVLNFSFHYIGDGGVSKEAVSSVDEALRTVSPGAALQFTDVVSYLFPDLTDGLSLGELQIDYTVPDDGERLVIQGRNYTDSDVGSFGMQLPAFAAGDGLMPGSPGRIVLAGLHNDFVDGSTTDYKYISRFGFAALGDGLVSVHAEAYDAADGSKFWSGDYSLNSAGYGHFVFIPTTAGYAPAEFAGHPAFNMVVTATSGDGTTPVAAFATVQDVRSRDLVFIPGRKPSS